MLGKEENKLVKVITDVAVLMGITAGIGFVAKNMLKECQFHWSSCWSSSLDDGTISKSRKGGNPGKSLLNALGPMAVEVLEENDEVMKSLDDTLKKALEKNKEYDEAQKIIIIYN